MRQAARRRGCANRAAALCSGRWSCRSCRARSCSTCTNGGNKDWGRFPPYRDLGYAATANVGLDFTLGTAGAGYGAKTVNLKGGLGSASATTRDGATVGAIVAVNAARQRDHRKWTAFLGRAIRAER